MQVLARRAGGKLALCGVGGWCFDGNRKENLWIGRLACSDILARRRTPPKTPSGMVVEFPSLNWPAFLTCHRTTLHAVKTMPKHPFAHFPPHRPLQLPDLTLPAKSSIVMLAPHPDDFDAIAITMRHLHRQGHQIHLAVLTSGANGVEDGWQGVHGAAEKAALREAEQRASCDFFGLPMERLVFMRLWEGEDEQRNEEAGREALRTYLHSRRPDLVFLPHGNDSNRTHRRTYETFHAIATEDGLRVHACLNQDAKTASMRSDLLTYFDEEDAAWKARMLRFHRSQQERNLKSRGQGFDERVLEVNRRAAAKAGGDMPYVEVFEIQGFGM